MCVYVFLVPSKVCVCVYTLIWYQGKGTNIGLVYRTVCKVVPWYRRYTQCCILNSD